MGTLDIQGAGFKDSDYHGKALPDLNTVNEIAGRILANGGPRTCTYKLDAKDDKPEQIIHYVARHDDVLPLLSDQTRALNLSHYDDIMGALPERLAFQVGEEDGQRERWEILGAAMDLDPHIRRSSDVGIEDLAKRAVSEVIDSFKARRSPEFNAVREFGFVVPYLVGLELTGLHIPKGKGFWLPLFIWFRNRRDEWGRRRRKTDKIKLTGLNLGASKQLLWSHLMFGHTFANFGLRSGLLKFVASYAAKKHAAHARKSMDSIKPPHPDFPFEEHLVNRFAQIKPAFVANGRMNEAEYDRNVRCLLVEIIGSLQILVGTSFANILDVIFDKEMGLADLPEILNSPAGKDFIDEALRLKPTTPSVYRIADKDIDHLNIKKDDAICIMTGAAGMDVNVFEKPYHMCCPVSDGPTRAHHNYLNFGPNEREVYDLAADGSRSVNPQVTHPCFGQHWARVILKEMLMSLSADRERFHNLRLASEPFAGVGQFSKIPDSLMMAFDREAP